MPTYDYHCKACGKEFEAFHSIKERVDSCPDCQSTDVERLISPGSGVVFKGAGWNRSIEYKMSTAMEKAGNDRKRALDALGEKPNPYANAH